MCRFYESERGGLHSRQRQGLNTPSLHLLLTIMRPVERNRAYVYAYVYIYICAYRCSHLPRDRYLGFFSPSEVAIVVAPAVRTCVHADAASGLREEIRRGLFADDFWPRLSILAGREFSQQFRSTGAAPRFLRFRRDCSASEWFLDSSR